jgi:hypothetical protein
VIATLSVSSKLAEGAEIKCPSLKKVEIDEVINQLNHLDPQQTKLFDGTLGVYPHRKFHIDLVQGAVAKHARPYPTCDSPSSL